MGLNEQWGGLDSRFGEARVVEGCLVARSAAGVATVAPGLIKMKRALGVHHSPSIDLQVGSATMAAGVDAPSVNGLADGFYVLYAHPLLDANGLVDAFELRYGGKLLSPDPAVALNMATALLVADPADGTAAGVQVGTEVAVVPEANYDASAFKMGAQVPDSDFYKGRSLALAVVQVATNDITAVSNLKAHRL